MKKMTALALAILLFCSAALTPVYAEEQPPEAVTYTTQATRIEDLPYAEYAASQLYALGFFAGTDKGFELEAAATRVQAAVLLCRLLGAENEAFAQNNAHPFTDVPQWASPFVGWLYKNSYVAGIGGGKYGSSSSITAQQYLTLLLTALGYKDQFTYENAVAFAVQHSLLSTYEATLYGGKGLNRGELVKLTYGALWANTQSGEPLYARISKLSGIPKAKFIEAGVQATWMHPTGYASYEDAENIKQLAADFIEPLNVEYPAEKAAITALVENLLVYTPVLTPEQVQERLKDKIKKIVFYEMFNYPDSIEYDPTTIYFPLMDPEYKTTLSYGFNLMNIIENSDRFWQDQAETVQNDRDTIEYRTPNGLTDLFWTGSGSMYRLRNIDHILPGSEKDNPIFTLQYMNTDEVSFTDGNVSYVQKCGVYMMYNALGREIVGKAFLGDQDDFDALCEYYKNLTGKELSSLITLTNRFCGNAVTYEDRPPNIEETTKAGKEYMTALLELCELRAKEERSMAFISEMDALLRCSVSLYDAEEFMTDYNARIMALRDNAN